jgi:uncharacterized membrane protein
VSDSNHTLVDELRKLGAFEQRVIGHILHRKSVARDPNVSFDEQMTLGERIADRVAAFGGSWPFIGIFVGLMTIWMAINVVGPSSGTSTRSFCSTSSSRVSPRFRRRSS